MMLRTLVGLAVCAAVAEGFGVIYSKAPTVRPTMEVSGIAAARAA